MVRTPLLGAGAGPAPVPAPGQQPATGPLSKVPAWAGKAGTRDPAAQTAADLLAAGDAAAPVADRLAAARRLIDSGWLDPLAWETFREWRPGSTPGPGAERAVADEIWDTDLGLGSVPAGPRSAGASLKERLLGRVTQSLTANFRAETQKLAEAARRKTRAGAPALAARQSLDSMIELIWPESPGLSAETAADRYYHDTVSVGRINDLRTESAHGAAASYWEALRDAAAEKLTAIRGREFGSAAVGALDAQEVDAVRAALLPMTTWVATAEETDRLADQVTGKARNTPEWQQLRGRLAALVIVAEVRIIAAVIPQETKVFAERWAELRQTYVNEISKPIWRYWSDNIVSSSLFGHSINRAESDQGLHRDVVASLRAVEQSAVRLAGVGSVADLTKARGPNDRGRSRAITQPGSEFRFEAISQVDWMRRTKRMSYHGTGRAIDFRSDTNPAIYTDTVRQLVSLLGGEELAEQSMSRPELERWSRTLAQLEEPAARAEQEAAAETDPTTKAALSEIARELRERRTAAAQGDPEAVRLRNRVSEIYDRVRSIETRFRIVWFWLKLTSPNDVELMRRLQVLIAEAIDSARKEIDDLTARLALPNAAKATLEGRLLLARKKLARLQTLDAALAWRTDPDPAITSAQAAILGETAKVAGSGLDDLPKWFVQAFVENGWSWGGTWESPFDAMHFDYMGPIADVR